MPNSDSDFVTQLASSLNVDKDAVLAKFSEMGIDQVNDLISAQLENNTAQMEEIWNSVADNTGVHPLLAADDQSAETQNAPSDNSGNGNDQSNQDVTEDAEPQQHNFAIGDTVVVGDADDEDAKEGAVKIVRGPSNTVGVVIDGVLEMIPRGQLTFKESVLGLTVPSELSRMLQLAGLPANPGAAPVQVNPIRTNEIPGMPSPQGKEIATIDCTDGFEDGVDDEDDSDQAFDAINYAFDIIQANLPNVKQKDVKSVRSKNNELTNKLLESPKPNLLKQLENDRS